MKYIIVSVFSFLLKCYIIFISRFINYVFVNITWTLIWHKKYVFFTLNFICILREKDLFNTITHAHIYYYWKLLSVLQRRNLSKVEAQHKLIDLIINQLEFIYIFFWDSFFKIISKGYNIFPSPV